MHSGGLELTTFDDNRDAIHLLFTMYSVGDSDMYVYARFVRLRTALLYFV